MPQSANCVRAGGAAEPAWGIKYGSKRERGIATPSKLFGTQERAPNSPAVLAPVGARHARARRCAAKWPLVSPPAATLSRRSVCPVRGARLAGPGQARQGQPRWSLDRPGAFAMGGGAARRSRLVTLAGPSCAAAGAIAEALALMAGCEAQTACPSRAWGEPCAHGWRCSLLAVCGPGGCDPSGEPADLRHLARLSALNCPAFPAACPLICIRANCHRSSRPVRPVTGSKILPQRLDRA